jgi:tetratricopeptide (TPR) repeat protein
MIGTFRWVSVVLALVAPLPLAAQDVGRVRARLRPYLEVVGTYRTVSPGLAVQQLLGWDLDRVVAAHRQLLVLTQYLASPPGSSEDLDLALVEAAVILHSEVALAAFAKGDAEAVRQHLDVAHRLVQWLDPSRRPTWESRVDPRIPRLDHRAWYLAMSHILPGLLLFDSANALVEAALARFPDDAALWLACGISQEGLTRQMQLGFWLMNRPPSSSYRNTEYQRARLLVDETRKAAVVAYRRALEIDGSLTVARLRLGRVLFDSGDAYGAERELLLVIARAGPPERYLAYLFLGRLDEQRDRTPQAIESYRAALAIDSACQACRVALAHALERAGETRASRDHVLALAERRNAPDAPDDQWWVYPFGHIDEGKASLERLRRAVTQP